MARVGRARRAAPPVRLPHPGGARLPPAPRSRADHPGRRGPRGRPAHPHAAAGDQAAPRVSPSVYLRDVRLDRARSDLVAGDPCSTTVAAVAREWGFGNLGRFASAYQVRFDEKPSHTLRR
ncbi:helix-turn-helix domain-containing protein [Rathayibacter tanaceti]|uniref:helix-turn-helix domain-containing protein n=1 Tax=Rathayibacter tanaceti TaxID=1671680 RepID=UPI0039B7745D